MTAAARAAWARVPVDDAGYFGSASLATLPDAELREVIARMERARYTGWRNHGGLWRAGLRLDTTHGARVLDYGTGSGLEALQYARAGNTVYLADIVPANIGLAARVLRLHDFEPADCYLLADQPPFAGIEPGSLDVVHMAGVLHHIPDPVPVVAQAARWLRPGGELRLMAYSNLAWLRATGTSPPGDVAGHPDRLRFVRCMDDVGDWADWYDAERLRARFGGLLDVSEVRYIADHGQYLTAILTRSAPGGDDVRGPLDRGVCAGEGGVNQRDGDV